eukprot:CAMPEP_0181323644 /NCGR_PEP_ID=MMETSP1101-20121128/19907_1 /TAXON_ID=46948 /ORGANISM="Rhodomonas abbreviata, Strain Caron Lab Isolate" /LENGTH=216 /DNA_ID=CAMNT_0023431709 /DNA_START=72 /DNA_END=722 /DNA_ORIENTATION=-
MAELSENMTGLASSDDTDDQRAKPLSEKSGYYYAHSQVSPEGPKTLVGAQTIYNHKPLDADQIQKLRRQDSEGESAWNKGGTWEEKDFSKLAEQRLKEELVLIQSPKSLVKFTEVSTVDECHCGVIFSRGKKKAFLEVEKIEIKWEVAAEGGGNGKAEVTELACSSSAEEVNIRVNYKKKGDGDDKQAVEADVKACKEAILATAQAVLAELSTPKT